MLEIYPLMSKPLLFLDFVSRHAGALAKAASVLEVVMECPRCHRRFVGVPPDPCWCHVIEDFDCEQVKELRDAGRQRDAAGGTDVGEHPGG